MKLKKLTLLLILSFVINLIPAAVNAAVNDIYSPFSATEYDETSTPEKYVKRNGYVQMNGRTHGQWICFKGLNFTAAPYAVAVANAVSADYTANDTYEFRIDSPSGKLISTLYITDCADWGNPVENIGAVTETVTGVHDLYVSTNQPNDLYNIYFMAKSADEQVYKPYSGTNIFPDMEGRSDEYRVNILNGLGIVDDYENGLYYPEMPETRAVFAKQLAYLLTDSVPEYTESAFTDVTADMDGYNEINFLYERSVIKGSEQRLFNPWSFITFREAATMTLRALGYGQICEYDDGYSKGYEVQASSSGLIGRNSFDDYVRRSSAAEILYNAINMNYIAFAGMNERGPEYKEEKYILKSTRGIESARGTVTATSYSGLIGGIDTKNGTCYIDTECYNTNGINVENYLGVLCEYYFKTESDGAKTLVCIAPYKNVKELLLNSKECDFSEITQTKIVYNDNGRNKTLKIPNDAVWIYNNRALTKKIDEVIDADTFRGTVRLVDNGDGYKTVFVEQYINIKIRAFDANNNVLVDDLSGKKYEFNDKKLFITDGNEAIKARRLKKDQLAELYISDDGEMNVLFVGESEVNGMASNIENNEKVTIDGKEYYIANEIKDDITLGVQMVFHLSRHGEIVWTERKDGSKQVGTYYRYKKTDGKTYISIITGANVINEFETAPKVYVDGVAMRDYSDFEDGIDGHPGLLKVTKYSPVLYKLNENGQIFMLDTVLDAAKNDNDTLVELYPYNDTIKYDYRGYTGCFTSNSSFTMDRPVKPDSTMIFINNGECYINSLKSYYTDEGHSFGFYSTKRDTGVADIIYALDYSRNNSTEFMVFQSFNEALDADNEIGLNVTFVDNGGAHKYFVSPTNEKCIKYVKSLVKGDVVRLRTDLKGEIGDIEVGAFFDGSEKNSAGLTASVNNSKGSSGGRDISDNFILGTVAGTEDGYIKIVPFGGKNPFWCKLSGNSLIKIKSNEIERGLPVDILNDGDKVLIRYAYGFKLAAVYE